LIVRPRFVVVAGALALAACRATSVAPRGERAELLVVAPHPDDELLMAGPLVADARAKGEHVVIAVVTNGDARCKVSGYVREAETLAAMEKLGVPRADVHFLGYPDGALDALGDDALSPRGHLDPSGVCVDGNTTYARNEANTRTVSEERYGHESPYGREALVGDLAWLIERAQPRRIVTAHPADDHPDHAATGLYLHRALERTRVEAEVLLGIVHAGPCWPTEERADCPIGAPHPATPLPPLPGPLAAYAPDVRAPWRTEGPAGVAAALASYASQLGAEPATNWLQSFVRADTALYRSPFLCGGSRRRCDDPRVPRRAGAEIPARPTAWSEGDPLRLEDGQGIWLEDDTHVRRLCASRREDGRLVVAFERFPKGRVAEGEAEAYRRFVVAAAGAARVAWIREAPGVVSLDLADDRGTFGRRLDAVAGELRASWARDCPRVP
jgi:LmbE family N-acetylglucosaminyl deacetylase